MILVCKYLMFESFKNKMIQDCDVQENIDSPNNRRYRKYLCDILVADFQSGGLCYEMLEEIEKLEKGAIDYTQWDGNIFSARCTRDGVQIYSHIDDADDAETRPEGRFTLAEVKAALIGWRKFLYMPKSLDTRLVIELPETGTP